MILIAGPEGVGKQRLALWTAQLLLCEAPGAEPCGACRSCRLVLGLAHADLHWIVPIPRPKASEPDKQVEEAGESLAELMEERRKAPLYAPADGMSSHGMATARLIARRAALTPVEGRRKVFILGEAERLVVQESSQEAANALLKLFEEPPPETYFLLTAADPGRLLPTIRSRTVPLRVGRLRDADVRAFLAAELEPAPTGAALDRLVTRAGGSIGAALVESDTGQVGARRRPRRGSRPSSRAPARRRNGPSRRPPGPRGASSPTCSTPSPRRSATPRGARWAPGRFGRYRPRWPARIPARLMDAIALVTGAREAAQGNVNPQLLLAVLAGDLAEVL